MTIQLDALIGELQFIRRMTKANLPVEVVYEGTMWQHASINVSPDDEDTKPEKVIISLGF